MLRIRYIIAVLLLGLNFTFLVHNLIPHIHHVHIDSTLSSDNHHHEHNDSGNHNDEDLVSFLLDTHSHDYNVFPEHVLVPLKNKLEFVLQDSPHKIIYLKPFKRDFTTSSLTYYRTVRQFKNNQFDISSYLLRAPPTLV